MRPSGKERKASLRRPAAAGRFYPSSERDCVELIEECFTHRFGPGELPCPAEERKGRMIGGVVPHAGWVFSGPIAAHAFRAMASDGIPETAVVIGPNHTGMGDPVAACGSDYSTPLGSIPTDTELLDALAGSIVVEDNMAHAGEHSVEVQVPFLQYLGVSRLLAVCMGAQDPRTSRELGKALASAVGSVGRDVMLIASTDFTHAGMHYSDPVPRGMTPGEYAEKRDRQALDAISANDPALLQKVVRSGGISMCGCGPVAAVLTASTILGGTTVRELAYSTSQHVSGERRPDIAVGYGSFAVFRGGNDKLLEG